MEVEDGHVTVPDLPGIGFEGKADLIRVMRTLSECGARLVGPGVPRFLRLVVRDERRQDVGLLPLRLPGAVEEGS